MPTLTTLYHYYYIIPLPPHHHPASSPPTITHTPSPPYYHPHTIAPTPLPQLRHPHTVIPISSPPHHHPHTITPYHHPRITSPPLHNPHAIVQLPHTHTAAAFNSCAIVNSCSPDPCQNNGTCQQHSDGEFTCNCPIGFAGSLCQHDFDECSSNPCANNATCTDLFNEFVFNHDLDPPPTSLVSCPRRTPRTYPSLESQYSFL